MTFSRPVRRTAPTLAAAVALLSLLACGKDPVSYSAPVGVTLNARPQDVSQGRISVEKNVNTEQGNPYSAYINEAYRVLGRAPSALEVTSATLTLNVASGSATRLEQVFTGTVTSSFRMKTSGAVIPVATVVNPTGAGPVTMALEPPPSGYSPQDFDDLLGGNFFVVLSGPAAAGFSTAGADAPMTATFTFVAYE